MKYQQKKWNWIYKHVTFWGGGGVEKLLTFTMNMNTDDDDDKTEVPPWVTFPKPTYVWWEGAKNWLKIIDTIHILSRQ